MALVLPMCMLISCSSVLCLLMTFGMFVCKSYVVLDQCDEPPPLFVLSVCAYGGAVGIWFGVLAFCVSFVSCIVMMSDWVLCKRFFSSLILFLMPFILI